MFGYVSLLDLINNFGGDTSLDSFLKAYKTPETNNYFPLEWFDDPEKLNKTQPTPYETFISKLRTNKPLKIDYSDYQSLLDGGLTSDKTSSKLKLKQSLARGQENYHFFTSVWRQKNMRIFKDFLRWYNNNKDVVPTPAAMQKMVDFSHNKGTDMLKLGCTLPNPASICLQKSTTATFHPSRVY